MNTLRMIRAALHRLSTRDQTDTPAFTAAEPRGPILFIGDSITAHWGMHCTALFAEQGFVNRGIGGEMAGQVRERLAPAIAEAQATGVHILCGINDIAHCAAHGGDTDVRGNVAAMLAEAHVLGLRTWVGSLTPAE